MSRRLVNPLYGFPLVGDEHKEILDRFSANRGKRVVSIDSPVELLKRAGVSSVSRSLVLLKHTRALLSLYRFCRSLQRSLFESYTLCCRVTVPKYQNRYSVYFPLTNFDEHGVCKAPCGESHADMRRILSEMVKTATNDDGSIHEADAATIREFESKTLTGGAAYTPDDEFNFLLKLNDIQRFISLLSSYLVLLNTIPLPGYEGKLPPSGLTALELNDHYRSSDLFSEVSRLLAENTRLSVLPLFCAVRYGVTRTFASEQNRRNSVNKSSLIFSARLSHAFRYYINLGYFILFGTNTFASSNGEYIFTRGRPRKIVGQLGITEFLKNPCKYNNEFFNKLSYLAYQSYFLNELNIDLSYKEYISLDKKLYPDIFAYFRVAEFGDKTDRLHFHYIVFMKHLPLGTVDPNIGLPSHMRRRSRINTLKGLWNFGDPRLSYAQAFRYRGDAFTRAGWLHTVDRDGVADELQPPEKGAAYLTSYISRYADMRIHNDRFSMPGHTFYSAMSRNVLNLHCDITELSESELLELCHVHSSVTDYSVLLIKMARDELARRFLLRSDNSVTDILLSCPGSVNFMGYQEYLYSPSYKYRHDDDDVLNDVSVYLPYLSLISVNPLITKLKNIGVRFDSIIPLITAEIPYVIPFDVDSLLRIYYFRASYMPEADLQLNLHNALSPVCDKLNSAFCNNDIFVKNLPVLFARIIVNFHIACASCDIPYISSGLIIWLRKNLLLTNDVNLSRTFASK